MIVRSKQFFKEFEFKIKFICQRFPIIYGRTIKVEGITAKNVRIVADAMENICLLITEQENPYFNQTFVPTMVQANAKAPPKINVNNAIIKLSKKIAKIKESKKNPPITVYPIPEP